MPVIKNNKESPAFVSRDSIVVVVNARMDPTAPKTKATQAAATIM